MAPKDVAAMISAEINGMDSYDAAVALSEMGYTGWVHQSSIWLGLGRAGWRWDVRSDCWYQGRVVKTVHVGMPEGGEPVWERDVAAAQCAVAISAILESRGGYAVQESNEYRG